MTSFRMTDPPDQSRRDRHDSNYGDWDHHDREGQGSRLLIVGGAVLGVGAVALVAWMAEQRKLAQRPKDSAPQRARKAGLSDGAAASTAVTIAGPLPDVMRAIAEDRAGALVENDRTGQVLARELLGQDEASFQPIEHQGDDVLSWRTEDGSMLVKLILRPVRGGRMTSVTAIVAREEGSSLLRPFFATTHRTRLKETLTKFRMRFETGEIARAH